MHLVFVLKESLLSAWRLQPEHAPHSMRLLNEERVQLSHHDHDHNILTEAYDDARERLRGDGIDIACESWIVSEHSTWYAPIVQVAHITPCYQILSWQWLVQRVSHTTSNDDDSLLRDHILPWLIATDDHTERLHMRQALQREHTTGAINRTKAQHSYDAPRSSSIVPTAAASASQELRTLRKKHNFLYLQPIGSNRTLATLDSATGLLWNNEMSDRTYSLSNAQSAVKKGLWAGMGGWQLPSEEQLRRFVEADNNPYRKGKAYRLAPKNSSGSAYWMANTGCCNVDDECWDIDSDNEAYVFSCHPFFTEKEESYIAQHLLEKRWQLRGTD